MIIVFFSTVLMIGRSMFEVGVLKPKSTRHVAAKNLCQLSLCTIVQFTIGYGLSSKAYGGIFGTEEFFMESSDDNRFPGFLISLFSCWYCCSIVSLTLAERCFISVHNFLTLFIAGIIFPIASSWVFGEGWLTKIGFIDAAGAGPIHLLGGTIGLLGTILL